MAVRNDKDRLFWLDSCMSHQPLRDMYPDLGPCQESTYHCVQSPWSHQGYRWLGSLFQPRYPYGEFESLHNIIEEVDVNCLGLTPDKCLWVMGLEADFFG